MNYRGKNEEREQQQVNITRHPRSNHDCLMAVCSYELDLFSVVARARNHFHPDVLEAAHIKLHSPVLCQQKEYVKVLYLV